MKKVVVIGAGLAGSEASYFLANNSVQVILIEGKSITPTEAQKSKNCGELVCTNSLKSLNPDSPHGLLKYEMEKLGSLILKTAYATKVPSGDALSVDREAFSFKITETLKNHPNIIFQDEVVTDPLLVKEKYGADFVVIATGPLTLPKLAEWIQSNISLEKNQLYFYDAIAPIIDADSLDMSKVFLQSRHKINTETEKGDYLNAPMNEQEYYAFIEALNGAEKVPAKAFEEYKYFEACLPVDVMSERGIDTARFSCMKPIGLTDNNGEEPFAVVQLRKENLLGSAYNLVGFQTRLTYKEQARVFRMIPGLENAQFLQFGSVHRNTFLNSTQVLNKDLSAKNFPNIYFAGQITGVEGYTESAACGLYVGHQVLQRILGKSLVEFPVETGIGSLINYITTQTKSIPTPSSINFGLFPEILMHKKDYRGKNYKKIKREKIAERSRQKIDQFLVQEGSACLE